jgi:DNA-binding NarL/FixJ family response regulator
MIANSELIMTQIKPGPQIRILIADDHRVVREGLTYLLNAEPDLLVVGWASNGLEAIGLVSECNPDVVLMDLQMPFLDGVEAIGRLKAANNEIKIIILTTFDTDEYIVEGLRAGARGYFLKDVPKEELYEAIRQVNEGLPLVQPIISDRLSKIVLKDSSEPSLTTRELEVLKLIAAGDRNREIANKLSIGEATVKGYITSIFQKLGVEDRTEAAMYALQKGWD